MPSGEGGGAVQRWAGIDCAIRLDPRWLNTSDDRVRLASVLRLLVAKEVGRPSMHRLAWKSLLAEYGADDVLDGLLSAGYLEAGSEPDELELPREEWSRLLNLRADPSAGERMRRMRQRQQQSVAPSRA